MGFKS